MSAVPAPGTADADAAGARDPRAIAEVLAAEVSGLPAGARMDSENELGARFGVPRSVIRRALEELEGRFLIRRVRGSGTYVGGRIDALASDYLPAALLGGVRTLVDEGVTDLPQAIGFITAGPARVAGLDDRGAIAEGLLADFAFVSDARGGWPHVVATFKAGEPQPTQAAGADGADGGDPA